MPCRQLTARAENAVRKQLSVGRLCPAAALLQQQTLVCQSWLYTAELTQLRGCGGTCKHTLGAPVSKGRNCKWKEGLSPGRTLWRRSYLILRWPLSTFVPAFQYRLVTACSLGGGGGGIQCPEYHPCPGWGGGRGGGRYSEGRGGIQGLGRAQALCLRPTIM